MHSSSKRQSQGFPLWILKSIYFLCTAADSFLWKFLNNYLFIIGFNTVLIAYVNIGKCIFQVGGSLFWARLVDMGFLVRPIMVAGFGLTGCLGLLILISKNFYYILILVSIIGFTNSVEFGIVDRVAVALTETSSESYGQQRLWSALSFGVCCFSVGAIVHIFNFSACFIGCAAFTILLLILVFIYVPSTLTLNDPNNSESSATHIRDAFSYESMLLLLNLFIYGNCTTFTEEFLLLYLEVEYDASTTFLGATVLVMTLGECIIFYSSECIINRLGKQGCLSFSMFIYSIRAYLYTIIPRKHVWLFLVLEPSHGVTFALMWSAAVAYGTDISPPHMTATFLSLVCTTFHLTAKISGLFIGGFLFRISPILMFRVGSSVSLLWSIAYFLLLKIFKSDYLPIGKDEGTDQVNTKNQNTTP